MTIVPVHQTPRRLLMSFTPNNIKLVLCAIILVFTFTACNKTNVKPDLPNNVARSVKTELEPMEFKCQFSEDDTDALFCESNKTYKTLIKYYTQSNRLSFMTVFALKSPCEDIYHEIMAYNWGYTIAQASCKENTVAFLTHSIVPEKGMSGKDIQSFLEWWSGALNDSLRESGLWDAIK